MYFENRSQAGQILAAELLEKYRYEDCAVVALTDGAVIVGEQIAAALHCILTMLLIEDIEIPGEGMSFGGVSQDGAFTYNGMFSAGEIEQYTSEFHGYLEEQKRISFQKLNRLLGDGGLINNDMLRDRVVILVSDGLDSGASLDVAVDFLKPIRIKRLVVASPVATVQSVDKLHMLADELHILSVKDNYLGVNHYYNQN
ncbi:MAG TPA: phosphoribosyltransferase family protein, partial [Candidatus Saccharibacteria bacterium]|nr:phosphoribosyltransferase family protein [Candidatus Saccharibacteria bacterium]